MLIIPYVLFFIRYYNEGINAENYRKMIGTRIIRNLQILGPATLHSINRLTRIKKEIIELVVLSLKEKDMISTFDIEHFQKQNGIILKSWKKA